MLGKMTLIFKIMIQLGILAYIFMGFVIIFVLSSKGVTKFTSKLYHSNFLMLVCINT